MNEALRQRLEEAFQAAQFRRALRDPERTAPPLHLTLDQYAKVQQGNIVARFEPDDPPTRATSTVPPSAEVVAYARSRAPRRAASASGRPRARRVASSSGDGPDSDSDAPGEAGHPQARLTPTRNGATYTYALDGYRRAVAS